MNRGKNKPHRFNSLSELHRVLGLPKPLHPMVSVVNNIDDRIKSYKLTDSFILDFYKVSYFTNPSGQFKYGQNLYDFDEGGMFFISPNQIVSNYAEDGDHSGYTLFIHPDFLLTYPLAKKIKQYGYFSYTSNELLHLSEAEKNTIIAIFKIIDAELKLPIDDLTQEVVISQIELLLTYSNRFYKRQFVTRKVASSNLLQKLEEFLEEYFNDHTALRKGMPTVQLVSKQMDMSASYFSDMLRTLTGRSAQQHIQSILIEKAKEKLSATDLSIGEIAYELGFEHSQSFSRLFKAKTKLSPFEFRQTFIE
ncbi:helix-turn-helix domain-containing protein [Pedobacter sp. WC2423]|uniref:helix-turn-helix domain-containing protein n=1 Tax=Pedobacter sp. WC2423 TaxID=3234142 RepID=UPI0034653F0E